MGLGFALRDRPVSALATVAVIVVRQSPSEAVRPSSALGTRPLPACLPHLIAADA
jgi:hypothetical protein